MPSRFLTVSTNFVTILLAAFTIAPTPSASPLEKPRMILPTMVSLFRKESNHFEIESTTDLAMVDIESATYLNLSGALAKPFHQVFTYPTTLSIVWPIVCATLSKSIIESTQSRKATMPSAIPATTSNISRLKYSRTLVINLNAILSGPPTTVATRSITANTPLNIRHNLSACSSVIFIRSVKL